MEPRYIEPFRYSTKNFKDERGTFSPLVLASEFSDFDIYQLNTVTTKSAYTFRGMHWQDPPYDQAKLIRCTFGKIIDFAIDIRKGSPNYGKSYGFMLNSADDWVYIPTGFAHGYITLPHNLGETFPTTVEYLVNNHYNKDSERGICIPIDIINVINQELPFGTDIIINNRDLAWPTINELDSKFKYEPDEQ